MRVFSLVALVASVVFAAPPPAPKPVVAVLYFDVPESGAHASELAELRKGLAEMTITELASNDAVTVVERARLEAVMAELQLQASNKVDPSTAQKIGKLLGAKYLVWGFIRVLPVKGEPVTYGPSVVSVEKGDHLPLKARKRISTLEQIADIQQEIRLDAEEAIVQAERLAPAQTKKAAAPRPTFKSALTYSRALDAKDKKDTTTAKRLLTEVVKEQPDFQLAQLDLLNLSK
jgi:TolB-like protein